MDEGHVRRTVIRQLVSHCLLIGAERAFHALVSEITRDRSLEIADRDAGFPSTRRNVGTRLAFDENRRLDALHGTGVATERADDEGERVDQQAEDRRIDEGIRILRLEHGQPGQEEAEDGGGDPRVILGAETGQEKQIGPDEETGRQARNGTPRIGPPPDQPAEHGRCDLGDGGKGQEADLGETGRVVGRAVIDIAEKQDAEDRSAANMQQRLGEILPLARSSQELVPQEDRQDHVVRHHDRKCHGGHDDHGRRRREAADESEQ